MFRSIRARVAPVMTWCLLAAGGCVVQSGDQPRGADSASADAPGAATSAQPTASAAAPGAPTGIGAGADSGALAASDSGSRAAGDTVAGALSPSARPVADVRVEVDLAARQLRVFRGQTPGAAYPVAVGSPEWPTRTGEWTITQVVWNPEWVPPDESWAEQRERRPPGDPKNPLGRVQLVYDPPRTVHGTNEPASIGRAVSHGSIRMRNADIARLGRDLMAAAGAEQDAAWIRRAEQNRTEKQIVDLPRVVPIRVF